MFGGLGRLLGSVRLLPFRRQLIAEFRLLNTQAGDFLLQRRGKFLGRRGRPFRLTDGDNTGSGTAAFVQSESCGIKLVGRHLRHEEAEVFAFRPVLGRKAEPDKSFDRVLRNRPTFGVNKAKIVLSDAVACLGLGAEGGDGGVGAGHSESRGQGQEKEQQRAKRGRTKTICFHDEDDDMPVIILRFFANVATPAMRPAIGPMSTSPLHSLPAARLRIIGKARILPRIFFCIGISREADFAEPPMNETLFRASCLPLAQQQS